MTTAHDLPCHPGLKGIKLRARFSVTTFCFGIGSPIIKIRWSRLEFIDWQDGIFNLNGSHVIYSKWNKMTYPDTLSIGTRQFGHGLVLFFMKSLERKNEVPLSNTFCAFSSNSPRPSTLASMACQKRSALMGGPPYTPHKVGAFLSAWGVQHKVSSAWYPQSNGRAELSVKTAKWLIYGNTKHGTLDTDSFVRALLQHRDTPLQEIGHSPAELLYGGPLRDHLPHPVDVAKIHPEWLAVASDHELALAKWNSRNSLVLMSGEPE